MQLACFQMYVTENILSDAQDVYVHVCCSLSEYMHGHKATSKSEISRFQARSKSERTKGWRIKSEDQIAEQLLVLGAPPGGVPHRGRFPGPLGQVPSLSYTIFHLIRTRDQDHMRHMYIKERFVL